MGNWGLVSGEGCSARLRWLLRDSVEVAGSLVPVLRGDHCLRVRYVPDAEVRLDLHPEAGDSLVGLRYPKGHLAGDVGRAEHQRVHRALVADAPT